MYTLKFREGRLADPQDMNDSEASRCAQMLTRYSGSKENLGRYDEPLHVVGEVAGALSCTLFPVVS